MNVCVVFFILLLYCETTIIVYEFVFQNVGIEKNHENWPVLRVQHRALYLLYSLLLYYKSLYDYIFLFTSYFLKLLLISR